MECPNLRTDNKKDALSSHKAEFQWTHKAFRNDPSTDAAFFSHSNIYDLPIYQRNETSRVVTSK